MDSERCSLPSATSESISTAADLMVGIELEAAEALAGLAQLATREDGNCDSGGKWGSKGKRGKKRVNSEFPLDDSVLNAVVDPGPSCSDIAPDQMNADKCHDEPLFMHVVINPSKHETNTDIAEINLSFVKSHPSFSGGRSRKNLNEDEKEERRLRRILANRESARQTIRRRQALCEELTRKAADLAWENESLKREKELALKEYQSLQSKNKHLKEQMAKVLKTEMEDSSGGIKSASAEKSAAPTANCPLLFYNQHPFSPIYWPSITQSSNALQSNHGLQNAIVVPPNISLPANGKLDSAQQQKENPLLTNGARTPLYILSCPWFFPAMGHGNGPHQQPFLGLKQIQEGIPINNQYSGITSSKATALVENQLSFLPEKVKSEAVTSAEDKVINDLNETPVEFPPDGGGRCAVRQSKWTTCFSQVQIGSVQPAASIKKETGTESEFFSYSDGICTETRQLMDAVPENQDSYHFSSKKVVDAAAATEARKRRKELTKLKNLHGRQCRMSC